MSSAHEQAFAANNNQMPGCCLGADVKSAAFDALGARAIKPIA